MLQKITRNRHAGFTVAQTVIMVAVAVVALLAVVAVPNFILARKRTAATHILDDLRLIDSATAQYAIDPAKKAGPSNNGADLFGDTYGPFTVDSIPQVPTSQLSGLSDVVPTGFWSPY